MSDICIIKHHETINPVTQLPTYPSWGPRYPTEIPQKFHRNSTGHAWPQVIAAGTAFVAYNGSGLQGLQPGPQKAETIGDPLLKCHKMVILYGEHDGFCPFYDPF